MILSTGRFEDRYGINGNISVPPPVILKLMLLLILYNVRSERELMETLPERLDWLWFLRYDLDDEIPSHSILSKVRSRWGVEACKGFLSVSFGSVGSLAWLIAPSCLSMRVSLTQMLVITL